MGVLAPQDSIDIYYVYSAAYNS